MSRVATRRALVSSPRRGITGWWTIAGQTVVAAYQPKGAADLAASYVNLANPGTYNAFPGVAPTWDAATGWTFDTTQYLRTGLVPNGSNWSFFARFSDVSINMYVMGGRHGPQDRELAYNLTAGGHVLYRYGNATVTFYTTAPAYGVIGLAGVDGYLDGSDVVTLASATISGSTQELYLGKLNNNGVIAGYGGAIQAVAIYSTTLSAADVAALTTRMQSL